MRIKTLQIPLILTVCWLSLRHLRLRDLSALSGLTNLVYLDLSTPFDMSLYRDTRVDISPLVALTNLQMLDLQYLPLTADAENHIATLEANGTEVRVTPREKEGAQ